MTPTLEVLKKIAKKVEPSGLAGCFQILPPVKVCCIRPVDHNAPGIAVGETFHIEQFDREGHFPNHLRFPERAWWWPADHFVIVN